MWPIKSILYALVLLFSVQFLEAQDVDPNILLIVVDDLGYGELGCYGGRDVPTPNIDAIALSGVRFTSGYVTAPFCAASRAALMTGKYQTRFGFEHNPIGAKNLEPGIGLPVTEKTIADRLRERGYATSLVGKWHLGGTAPFHPQRRGFDEFFGFLHEGHYYVPHPWPNVTSWLRRKSLPNGKTGRWSRTDGKVIWSTHMGTQEPDYDADNPLVRASQPTETSEHLTDAFTREACSFIDRHTSQPWFLCVAYNAVHSPMQASNAYLTKFAHIDDIHRRIFAAMLSQLDDGIGKINQTLKSSEQQERTIVFFVSDNGGPTKELTSSNQPLRGGKGDLFEGGIRVPMLACWPNHIPSNCVVHHPISTLDLAVTVLSQAKCKYAAGTLDGMDLVSWLAEKKSENLHDYLYWRVDQKNAIRHGNWKLIRNDKSWQLFDLENDIGETTDVAMANAGLVNRLSEAWEKWNQNQEKARW